MTGGDDERSTVAVLHVGGMHFGSEQQAGCVADDMTFAAFDPLGRIKTARAAGLGCLDRLAVDNASRGAWLGSSRFAGLEQQLEIDPRQYRTIAPSVKIMLHRRIGRELARQLPPLASGSHHIEQRIDHCVIQSLAAVPVGCAGVTSARSLPTRHH